MNSKNDIEPTPAEMINQFLRQLKFIGLSEGTIYSYNWTLTHFFMSCPKKIIEVSFDDTKKWIDEYAVNKSESIINQRLSALSSFFNYCMQKGYLDKIPLKKRWWRKVDKTIPKFLENGEKARVKVEAEHQSLRNRAIIELFLSSGMRVGELVKLNINNINRDSESLWVIGKGNKERVVHFSPYCAFLLQRLLEGRLHNDEPLFINRFHKRLSKCMVQKIIKELGKESGLSRPLHPHVFRHTFATDLARKGADILFIAEELGHESVQTTAIYVQVPDEVTEAIYKKCME